jgi:hypothetical protein
MNVVFIFIALLLVPLITWVFLDIIKTKLNQLKWKFKSGKSVVSNTIESTYHKTRPRVRFDKVFTALYVKDSYDVIPHGQYSIRNY